MKHRDKCSRSSLVRGFSEGFWVWSILQSSTSTQRAESPNTYHFLPNAILEKKSLEISCLRIFINYWHLSYQWAWPLESRSMIYGRSTSAAEMRRRLLFWMAENQMWRDRKHCIWQPDLVVWLCEIYLNISSPYLWENCGQWYWDGGTDNNGWCSEIAQDEVLGKSLMYIPETEWSEYILGFSYDDVWRIFVHYKGNFHMGLKPSMERQSKIFMFSWKVRPLKNLLTQEDLSIFELKLTRPLQPPVTVALVCCLLNIPVLVTGYSEMPLKYI